MWTDLIHNLIRMMMAAVAVWCLFIQRTSVIILFSTTTETQEMHTVLSTWKHEEFYGNYEIF